MLESPNSGRSSATARTSSTSLFERRNPRALAFTVLLTVALTAAAVLYAARLIALFPLGHDVTAANSTGDDWLIYHQNALSVLNGGLTMPIVDGAYVRPAGLGYVYFIASIYAVAGVRSEAVYLVQGLLLIAGIIGMYAVFRPRLSSLTSLAFLVALTVFMYVDMYRALTFRLLSENLLFPLLPALLFCVIKGEATAKLRYFAIGGVVCGLCFLVRPNSLLLGPAAAVVILFFRSPRSFSWRTQAALVLLAACAAVVSLLPLRNYAVTGQATVASVTNPSDWSGSRYRGQILPLSERLQGRLRRSARRVAYLVGMPQFMRPAFRFRPHWLAMWGAFIWYLYTLIQRKGQFWEVLVVAVAVSYFAPLMEFGDIASYGSRMLVPGLPLILVLAIRGLDGSSLLPSLRSRPT